MRRLLSLLTVAVCLGLAPAAAHASFHLWDIVEVFSDASGDIQYIELHTTSPSQQFVNGETITANSDGSIQTFTFPGNSPAGTTNKRLLIATAAYNTACGTTAQADFIIPADFFNPAATTLTLNFGAGSDIETITIPKVPVDGSSSYNNGVIGRSTPTNFAGAFECLNAAMCADCSDGTFCNGAETCTATGCAGTNPCPGMMCSEVLMCFECDDAGDCNDGNICTDDSCDLAGECVNDPNTMLCNDGLFCTTDDTCTDPGLACVGATPTCGVENCSEGGDFCGDCDDNGDCDDGMFCNGAEVCNAAACGPAAAGPCDLATTTCDEGADACPLICGDGTLDGAEVCDDGNTTTGDGCADCAVEDGFTCDGAEPTVCTEIPPPDAGVPDAEIPSPDAEVTDPLPDDDAGCCSTGDRAPTGGTILLALIALVSLGRARRVR